MTATQEDLVRAAIAADVLRMADAAYWRHRAEEFEQAKPRPGESHGQATHEELTRAWNRCHASAAACRNRARLIEMEADG